MRRADPNHSTVTTAMKPRPHHVHIGETGLAPLLMLLLLSASASAQIQRGQIQGRVVDESGRPIAGVTVVASGPALPQDQHEVTDVDGHYLITRLPTGDGYQCRFYFNEVVVERPDLNIVEAKTLDVSIRIAGFAANGRTHVIRERAPALDIGSAATGVELTQDILEHTPIAGRGYASALALAPGASDPPLGIGGDVGVSFAGATGAENAYLIDGVNTTDPNLGLLGTEIHRFFIKEILILAGGYQAEYGRATGAVVSIVTKSGSNAYHGSVFAGWGRPLLAASPIARLGEALALTRQIDHQYDLGFEVGGPLIKDRLWFYAGFAPTFTNWRTSRIPRRLRFDATTGTPKRTADYVCPNYLANRGMEELCQQTQALALQTEELGNREATFLQARNLYNWIGKLHLSINPDHEIYIGYIGSPTSSYSYSSLSYSAPADAHYTAQYQGHDVMVRYGGKILNRKIQFDIFYGYHFQSTQQRPDVIERPIIRYRASSTQPYSLADFEDVPECRIQDMQGPVRSVMFNPCPLTTYIKNGFGSYTEAFFQRHQIFSSTSYSHRLLGSHTWKLGFDFEDSLNNTQRTNSGTDLNPNDPRSGHRIYSTNSSGEALRSTEYIRREGGNFVPLDHVLSNTETRNYAVYLRDSWNVGFLRGLVINSGIRWEGQELFGQLHDPQLEATYGSGPQVGIYGNWAPRIGAVYDITRKGQTRLYLNFGRFYESIPMAVNDRQFSGEGLLSSNYSKDCEHSPVSGAAASRRQVLTPPCQFTYQEPLGGTYSKVMPGLQGQYVSEVVAGVQLDVGHDLILGLVYIHRELGDIVEDVSINGGRSSLLANPGRSPDSAELASLEANSARLRALAKTNPQDNIAAANATDAQDRADAYRNLGTLPRPVRDYNGLTLSVNKRLSGRLGLSASYTYSRTLGNYPGTFQATSGQLWPNTSAQYDLLPLLVNRDGPLPTDRPHNLRLIGIYQHSRSATTGIVSLSA